MLPAVGVFGFFVEFQASRVAQEGGELTGEALAKNLN